MKLKTDHEDQKDGARAYGHQGFQHKPEGFLLLKLLKILKVYGHQGFQHESEDKGFLLLTVKIDWL